MASTKLTLSVEEAFVDKAKRYASKHKTSLSKLFLDFVSEKIDNDPSTEEDPFFAKLNGIEISEKVKAITGVVKVNLPSDADLKKLARDAKHEHLEKRYGL